MKRILLCIIFAAVTVFCSCKPDEMIDVGFSSEVGESSNAVQSSEAEKTESVKPPETETLPSDKKTTYSDLITKEDLVKRVVDQYGKSADAKAFEEQKKAVFKHYDGADLQLWNPSGEITYVYDDTVIFCKEAEGKTPEEMVKIMFSAKLDELKKKSEQREYTILRYELPEQKLCTEKEIKEKLGEAAEKQYDIYAEREAAEGLAYLERQAFLNLYAEGYRDVPENWYVIAPLEGWYEFEGKVAWGTYEEAKRNIPSEMQKDGMIPFAQEGDMATISFVLVREDNAWCLMRTTQNLMD